MCPNFTGLWDSAHTLSPVLQEENEWLWWLAAQRPSGKTICSDEPYKFYLSDVTTAGLMKLASTEMSAKS